MFNCEKEGAFMAANIEHSTDGSSLAEVIDRILDRGCVIDIFVRVTLVGIELLAVEARIVIASVDTWLKYAEAVGLTTTFDQMSAVT
jgi:gas vesicle structural protein